MAASPCESQLHRTPDTVQRGSWSGPAARVDDVGGRSRPRGSPRVSEPSGCHRPRPESTFEARATDRRRRRILDCARPPRISRQYLRIDPRRVVLGPVVSDNSSPLRRPVVPILEALAFNRRPCPDSRATGYETRPVPRRVDAVPETDSHPWAAPGIGPHPASRSGDRAARRDARSGCLSTGPARIDASSYGCGLSSPFGAAGHALWIGSRAVERSASSSSLCIGSPHTSHMAGLLLSGEVVS